MPDQAFPPPFDDEAATRPPDAATDENGGAQNGQKLLAELIASQYQALTELGDEELAQELADESPEAPSPPGQPNAAPAATPDLGALLRQATDAPTLAVALNAALRLEMAERNWRSVKLVTPKVLNFYAYHNAEKRYRTFEILKKTSGQKRTIKAPHHGLLRLQRLLLRCLTAAFTTCDDAAHGFVPGRSVLTNAQPHAGRRFVLNLDLRDFFPSTSVGRVVAVLRSEPFRLAKPVAHLVGQLCGDHGSLPQGAPTSPLLTNAVCQRLDRRLRQLAQRHRCRYTRYADDLTFSSNRPAFSQPFHQELNAVLAAEGYTQNPAKQRLQTPDQRQEVTGLVVNERPNVPREYVRQIRAMLHNWETKGYEAASATLRQHYLDNEAVARRKKKVPKLEKVLAGKIAYLGMVRGEDDLAYNEILTKFNNLKSRKNTSILASMLSEWQQHGLEWAINSHFSK
jgi:RNA-directed DNA polymerase